MIRFRADTSFYGIAPIARAAQRFEVERALDWVHNELGRIYPNVGGSRARPFAASAISLAEECRSLSFLIKPAMYDLLCQPEFRFQRLSSTKSGEDPISSVFYLSGERVLQLITARNALQEEWRQICSPQACLGEYETIPTNKCQCATLFTKDGLDGELSEEERKEGNEFRQERMLAAWSNTLNAPPSGPLPTADDDTPPSKRTAKRSSMANKARPSAFAADVAPKTIISHGNLDIILGVKLLIAEPWENLECNYCITKRKQNWRRLQRKLWKKLDEYFGVNMEGGVSEDDE